MQIEMAEILIHNKFKAKMELRTPGMIHVTFDEPDEEFNRFFVYWSEFEYRKKFTTVVGTLDSGVMLVFSGCFPGGLVDRVKNDPQRKYFRIMYDSYKYINN